MDVTNEWRTWTLQITDSRGAPSGAMLNVAACAFVPPRPPLQAALVVPTSPVVQGILLPEVSPGSASMESWIAGALELDSRGSWVMGGPRLRRSSSTVSSVDCSESDGELIPHQEPSNEEESGSPAVVQPSSSSSAVPESCRAGPEVYHIASVGRASVHCSPGVQESKADGAGSQPGPSAPSSSSSAVPESCRAGPLRAVPESRSSAVPESCRAGSSAASAPPADVMREPILPWSCDLEVLRFSWADQLAELQAGRLPVGVSQAAPLSCLFVGFNIHRQAYGAEQAFSSVLTVEAKLLDDLRRNLRRFGARNEADWTPATQPTFLEAGGRKAVEAFLDRTREGSLLHGVLVSWAGT